MSPSDVKDMLAQAKRYEDDRTLSVHDLKRDFAARLFPFPPVVSDDEALMSFGRSASGFFRWTSPPAEYAGYDKLIVADGKRVMLLSGISSPPGSSTLTGRADVEPAWRLLMLLWPQELVDVAEAFRV